ncbi:hypothetical protein [Lysobacter sp. Hz 25]|uniref:hypothetical protein n=1 Tax=Lysobacter sp. Hz 25 TaxID=3383698 RepID=UPI0038D4AE87
MISSSNLDVVSAQLNELHPLERAVVRLLGREGFEPELIIDVVLATRTAILVHSMAKGHPKLSRIELANLRDRAQHCESITRLTRELIDIRDVESTLGFKLDRVQRRRALGARQKGRTIEEIAAAILRQPKHEAAAKRAFPTLKKIQRAEIWRLNIQQLDTEDIVDRLRDSLLTPRDHSAVRSAN